MICSLPGTKIAVGVEREGQTGPGSRGDLGIAAPNQAIGLAQVATIISLRATHRAGDVGRQSQTSGLRRTVGKNLAIGHARSVTISSSHAMIHAGAVVMLSQSLQW